MQFTDEGRKQVSELQFALDLGVLIEIKMGAKAELTQADANHALGLFASTMAWVATGHKLADFGQPLPDSTEKALFAFVSANRAEILKLAATVNETIKPLAGRKPWRKRYADLFQYFVQQNPITA